VVISHEHDNKAMGSLKDGIYLLADQLLAFEKRLCFMELVTDSSWS
jgi:hypothetical protein